MLPGTTPGQVVILNGTPRSGKSSIATVIQNTFEGVWMNLGVDRFKQMIPERYQPGIGLRPGGERPDLEPLIVLLYRAMYEAIALHSRLGLNVVVDVGHHDAYAVPREILPNCARQLKGLPVLFVGVRCPVEVVMQRRRTTWQVGTTDDGRFRRLTVHLPPAYAQRLFDARNTGASDQQMRQIIAEGLKETYFQDGGSRALGLSDVTLNDIDYLDLDY